MRSKRISEARQLQLVIGAFNVKGSGEEDDDDDEVVLSGCER